MKKKTIKVNEKSCNTVADYLTELLHEVLPSLSKVKFTKTVLWLHQGSQNEGLGIPIMTVEAHHDAEITIFDKLEIMKNWKGTSLLLNVERDGRFLFHPVSGTESEVIMNIYTASIQNFLKVAKIKL